jgi:ribosomal protein L31E
MADFAAAAVFLSGRGSALLEVRIDPLLNRAFYSRMRDSIATRLNED